MQNKAIQYFVTLAEKKQQGVVHSIYKHTINLLFDDEFVSVTTIDDVFYNAIVIGEDPSTWSIKKGDCAQLDSGLLTIAKKYTIRLDSGAQNPQVQYPITVRTQQKKDILEWIFDQKNRYESARALYSYCHHDHITVTDEQSYVAEKIQEYFRQEQSKEFDHDSFRISGLGRGLTPSGDDILAGRLLIESNHAADKKVLSTVKTTEIAKQMLAAAFLGYHKHSIVSCINYIAGKEIWCDRKQIKKKILSIGHSSGIDTVVGILYALIRKEVEQ